MYSLCVPRVIFSHDRGVRHERKSRTLWQKSEIIGNQLEITEIWLEIRNQDPVEIRKSARNPRETPPFCLSMRSRPFAHAHLRNPQIRVTKAGNQLEISWKSVGNHSEGGKSVGNHRNPEISYAEKARVGHDHCSLWYLAAVVET